MEIDSITKNQLVRKKIDLLKFQKSLNEQFLEILEQKNSENSENITNQDSLGLSASFRDLKLFISLTDLQSIATRLSYENSIRTKSWILGFNQEHGQIYTIFNMEKILNLLLNDKTDFELVNLKINSNILYLQSFNEENYGVLLDEFDLDYTAEFTMLYDFNINQEEFYSWNISEGVDFNVFLKKENMSELEWGLVNKINSFSNMKSEFKLGVYPQYNKEDKYLLLAMMVKRVYLDAFGKKPVFVLNVENLTKFLINVSPF
jgi:hypothetical protein